jgi:hypothetical protein
MIIARQQLGKNLFASGRDNNVEPIAKQRRGKQASSRIHTVFSVGSVQSGYKRNEGVVESTGNLESETVKYGHKSHGIGTRK